MKNGESPLKHLKPWSARADRWTAYSVLFLCVLFLLFCATFLHYGLTWDEQDNRIQGSLFVKWFTSGFQDRSIVNEEFHYYLYGQFFNMLARLASALTPQYFYEISHLIIAGFGFLGLVAAFLLGRHIGGPFAGFLSLVFLALTPVYYGHSFNNPKDIPLASCMFVALYYMIRVYDELPRPSGWFLAQLGIWTGLALGIRFGAFLLLGYFALAFAFFFLKERFRVSVLRKIWRPFCFSFLKVTAIAWVIMLVFSPYSLLSPLYHPLKALRDVSRFGFFALTTLFDGEFVSSTAVPWYYVPRWLSVILPEFYFLGFLAAAFLLGQWLWGRGKLKGIDFRMVLLLVAAVFPVFYVIWKNSVIFDSIRHLMFIVPPLAVFAAVCVAKLLELKTIPQLLRRISGILLIVLFAFTIKDMVELHPYQSVYFNRIVAGGLPGAYGKFETDYWGSSYKEGVEWVLKNIDPGDKAPMTVGTCSIPILSDHYFKIADPDGKRFLIVETKEAPSKLVLTTTRWNCHEKYLNKGRVLHVVTRQQTPLLYVFEVP